jgi:Maltokinase N-terminal cap domain
MSIIHKTTLTPTKLELLTGWLPGQPWYVGQRRAPELLRAGGFRLDDPQGEVGIEFMVATDGSDDRAVAYLVPLTYRASALAGAEAALVGTTEHGVLGRRWVYDGVSDPVLVGQLVALLHGRAEPQMQSVSDTPDPTVTCVPMADGIALAVESAVVGNGPHGTGLRVGSVNGDGALVITLDRVVEPGLGSDDAVPGSVYAGWRWADGTAARGRFAAARYA